MFNIYKIFYIGTTILLINWYFFNFLTQSSVRVVQASFFNVDFGDSSSEDDDELTTPTEGHTR